MSTSFYSFSNNGKEKNSINKTSYLRLIYLLVLRIQCILKALAHCHLSRYFWHSSSRVSSSPFWESHVQHECTPAVADWSVIITSRVMLSNMETCGMPVLTSVSRKKVIYQLCKYFLCYRYHLNVMGKYTLNVCIIFWLLTLYQEYKIVSNSHLSHWLLWHCIATDRL